MNKTFEILENLLKKDERFVSREGKVMRNAVYEASNKMDEKLILLLMSDEKIKEIFFKKVNDIYVYDKQKFNFVINNRQMLPDSYTRYRQDIGLVNNKDDYISATNDVVLSFPFKDCVLEFDSTDPDQKREEVFYNEILAHDEIDHLFSPKVLAKAKLVDRDGEKDITTFSEDSNLLIKGNNLLAMYSLLPRYKGKIKLMYWDILYNTDSDQVPYADSFKHSSWLVMMKNRLEVVKQLLRDDGVICLQCDDNEMAYLKVLCDEIFGREKIVNLIVVEMASTGGLKRSHKDQHFLKTKEYLLIYYNKKFDKLECLYDEWQIYDVNYSIVFDEKNGITSLKDEIKNLNALYSNLKSNGYLYFDDILEFLINNRNRIYRRHSPSAWANRNINQGEIVWEDKSKSTRNEVIKVYNDDKTEFEYLMKIRNGKYERLEPLDWNYYNNTFKLLRGDIWKNYYRDMGNVNKQGGVKLSGGKKPERLLIDILLAFTNENDIVLDAYFGTGTTGSASIKLNRKFVGIEQLDEHFKLSKIRLINVLNGQTADCEKQYLGGGSFIYCELKKLNENYIESIKQANTKKELNIIWNKMGETGFISCFADKNKIDEILQDIDNSELDLDSFKKLLIEILDKNQLYVNYEDMNDIDFKVSEKDKKFTESFYNVK